MSIGRVHETSGAPLILPQAGLPEVRTGTAFGRRAGEGILNAFYGAEAPSKARTQAELTALFRAQGVFSPGEAPRGQLTIW